MMTIFNEINARKIKPDEINVFKGFFNNMYFLLIIFISVAIQIVMVEVGGPIVKVRPLNYKEHLICIALGVGSLLWGLFLKLVIPVSWFGSLAIKQDPLSDEQELNSA